MTSTEATAPPRPATAAQAVIVGLLSMLIMVIDGYDMGAMPIVVPHLAPLWGVQPATFGLALSAVVIGLGLGAFLLAPLGDRFGRRVTTVASLAVISLATIGTGLATTPGALFWWRLLTGIGLGACLPNVLAILAQIIPAERRASAMTIVSCGIPIGAAGAGAVVPWLTRAHGWQAAFFAPGVLMLVMTLVVALYLSRIPLPATAPQPVRAWTDIPIFAPLRRGLVLRTAIFCGLFCFNALSMYAITSWLPTVLKRAGFTFENASLLAAIVQLGGLLGGLLLATQIDRHRTIAALLAGYGLVALALVSLTFVAPGFAGWGLILLLIGMGVGGAHIALPAVAANIYPATMLSAGIGLAVTVARLGAVAGSMAGAALIGANVSSGGFFLALLVPVGLCAFCVLAFAAARLANGPSEQALAEGAPAEQALAG
ncbi:MFS transporter [Sphingobium nicotianae]|uniref:MFS transporter n=1 Tax=Sphingobium nicotianae TaxID=2782607 RepID=A0A9X1DDD3_9SPHN|nr:MFS transporter [Sphingobium nicotianae]MBT2187839.1 MFS transporter [Sphingobium nicotianae]